MCMAKDFTDRPKISDLLNLSCVVEQAKKL